MGVDAVKQAWQPQPDPEIPVVTNSKLPLPKQSAVAPWGLLGAQLKIQPTRLLVCQTVVRFALAEVPRLLTKFAQILDLDLKAKILMSAKLYPICVKMVNVLILWDPIGAYAIGDTSQMFLH